MVSVSSTEVSTLSELRFAKFVFMTVRLGEIPSPDAMVVIVAILMQV